MRLPWLKEYNLLTFDQIDSTNSEALRIIRAGIVGNFVIWANKQTAGRGQRSRSWQSLEGNLHMSILLDCNIDAQRCLQLPFLAANAVCKSILFFAKEKKIDPDISLKWPNDVLISGRKVAGILVESINIRGRRYVVIGFGTNIMQYPTDLPYPATSLKKEKVNPAHSDEFLNILMTNFDKLFKKWNHDGNFIKTREYWLKRAYNLNKVVTIDNGDSRISGVFREIDVDGSIKLELAGGQFYNLTAGEIINDTK
jgi:BirA family biotin operon repressor/biotin-[acetyl-CoA-carboxylase] ligase